MSDSIQKPFERFQISPEDLEAETSNDNDSSKIPIIQRSLEAKKLSLKLRQVSPVCVLVVGMAGSGKTTLMAALQRSLTLPSGGSEESGEGKSAEMKAEQKSEGEVQDSNEQEENKNVPVGYCLNLDPATKLVPFGASIDIRDTIDYKVSLFANTFTNLCEDIRILMLGKFAGGYEAT